MDKETVFREIRQQQALIWAGAGLSRYAGYPMGAGVVKALYNALSGAQRQLLAESLSASEEGLLKLPLPDFAQHFIDLHQGNKQRLVQIVTQLFSASPVSKTAHDQLASIAYIDYIVTTNYDLLFEMSYGIDKLHVVTQADNIPQIGDKPTTLFKIHGELSRPKSLIIAQEDYRAFFDKADDVVWTQLRALMSTKTIVFIGYSVEDPNVLDVFTEIIQRLGKLMRPAYVIGPSMDFLRIQRLQKLNIFFIQSTGEEFISQLANYIKETAIIELPRDGLPAVAPIARMLSNMGLKFDLRLDGQTPLIDNIYRENGKVESGFSFQYNSIELHKALEDLQKGKITSPIKVDTTSVINFSRKVEGFSLPVDNIKQIWLAKAPGLSKILDIKFSNNLLLKNVKIEGFGSGTKVNIVVLSDESRLEIVVRDISKRPFNCKLHFTNRYPLFPNIESAQRCARTMLALGNAETAKAYYEGQVIWQSPILDINKKNTLSGSAEYLLRLIDALSTIQDKYSILFENFSTENKDHDDIFLLAKLLSMTEIKQQEGQIYELELPNPDEHILKAASAGKQLHNQAFIMTGECHVHFQVLDWELCLKWKEIKYLESPVCKKVKNKPNHFQIWSKTKTSISAAVELYSTDVIKTPTPAQYPNTSSEERITETFPQH